MAPAVAVLKERIYAFRDQYGQWDPKNQRPELWNVFNSRIDKGQSIRVFPLSNWTELDCHARWGISDPPRTTMGLGLAK